MTSACVPRTARDDGHVLIVEDERVSRKALAVLLRSCGYQTRSAGSAEEAINLLSSDELAEFALVDVDLPGMSGLELAKRLKHIRPDIFTVLITGADGERVRNFMRDHPVAYLPKPLDFERLRCLLHEAQGEAEVEPEVQVS